ncbi:MAG: hypothetical protein FJZ08_05115, partial [Candidatus Omnitrophica bacterium]|nr:hypothetical protein [Candidatus Omnitrophota bacterium]
MSNWRDKIWVKIVALTVAGVFLFSDITWAARTDIGGYLPKAEQNTSLQIPAEPQSGFAGFLKGLANSISNFFLPEALAVDTGDWYGVNVHAMPTGGNSFHPIEINIKEANVPQPPEVITAPEYAAALEGWNNLVALNLAPEVYVALTENISNLDPQAAANYIEKFTQAAEVLLQSQQQNPAAITTKQFNAAMIEIANMAPEVNENIQGQPDQEGIVIVDTVPQAPDQAVIITQNQLTQEYIQNILNFFGIQNNSEIANIFNKAAANPLFSVLIQVVLDMPFDTLLPEHNAQQPVQDVFDTLPINNQNGVNVHNLEGVIVTAGYSNNQAETPGAYSLVSLNNNSNGNTQNQQVTLPLSLDDTNINSTGPPVISANCAAQSLA